MESPSSERSDIKSKFRHERRVKYLRRAEDLLAAFTPGERLMLYVLAVMMSLSTLAIVALINRNVSVTIPSKGGSLTEGVLGPARFINPVLTMSEADEELTQLVYSGLMRPLSDGRIVPDIAESYQVSQDGTVYTFKIRANATFHDGSPVTSADVLYTVLQAQNPAIKSPRRADWEGVVVSAPDSHTVVFKLPKSYAPFIENTAMGILPQHLWKDTDPEEFPFNPLNTHPVGSGPYRLSSLDTDSTGSPVRYTLVPFKNFALGTPYLKSVTLLFYPNEESEITAFNQHSIDAIAGVAPGQLSLLKRTDTQTISVSLPRIFGIFFNQGHSAVLSDASVRSALNTAVDKDRLVSMVLGGYGVPLSSPMLPENSHADSPAANAVSTAYTQDSLAAAKQILTAGGWKFDQLASPTGGWTKGKQTLALTLSTADAPELVQTADAVATAWRQMGVKVSVQVYPIADLNTTVLRPRNYDAILFGEVVGRSLDLFAFWHSSQRNDPGLNLALYANSKADTLLGQARATTDIRDRDKLYSQFAELLKKDQPAVFLYAPEFIYVVPKDLQGIALGAMTVPSDRFLGIYGWYTNTEHVWSIFTNQSDNQTF